MDSALWPNGLISLLTNPAMCLGAGEEVEHMLKLILARGKTLTGSTLVY